MAIAFIRTIVLYILVICAMRIMGKRQIGELQPSELVVAIMISDLATVPVSDIAIPLLSGVIPIMTLIIFEVTISFLTLKSEKARNIITGKPTYLIKDGIIAEKQMRNMRYNIEDLLEELRLKDCPNVADVHTAILETNGELSVVLKSDKRSVTPNDLKIKPNQESVPLVLISDGKIRFEHLRELNKDIKWLEKKLADRNIKSTKDVFLFSIDSDGIITMQMKDGAKN
ncbi:MAG: DUF421 domain-containing protein [Oscillospiraceae bacterium]|nr:DUF421 domain-containing protein [Oscillospiraceae bacterium]